MLSLIAFSLQAAFAMAHGPNRSHDPNVVVPSSSMPQWFDRPGTNHTNYLIYTGSTASDFAANPSPSPSNLFGPLVSSPAGFHPDDIRAAYNVPALQGAKTIVIVDAYSYPTAQSDFNTFSTQFGLPVETSSDITSGNNQVLQVISSGPWTPPVDAGWDVEQALDIEWAHAMAPNAKIILVESLDNGQTLFDAITFGASLQDVHEVSMSFGAGDGSYESNYVNNFQQPGVVFFASTGDSDGAILFPSVSDYVVGVGGTSLRMNSGHVTSETGWTNEGGGMSAYSPLPSYQRFLQPKGFTKRVVPDLAAVADPGTGVAIYDSAVGGWLVVGGTSVASPVVAGITNAQSSAAGIYQASSADQLAQFYGWLGTSHFRDIVQGSNSSGLRARYGWDTMSGCGAPLFVWPITLTLPDPGQLAATPNGRMTFPFAAVDTVHPGNAIVSHIVGGPSWATWDGTTLTVNPPAGTKTGIYPMGLESTEPNYAINTVIHNVSIRVAPANLLNATWSVPSVVSGGTARLTINLTNPAPSGGLSVTLSSNSSAIPIASSARFAEGATIATLSVVAGSVTKPTSAIVYVTYNGTRLAVPIRVMPGA